MPQGEPGARSQDMSIDTNAGQPASSDADAKAPVASTDEAASVEPAMVDRGMQAQLGQQLRALFDHVASEPVPDRLLKLLETLESKEKKR